MAGLLDGSPDLPCREASATPRGSTVKLGYGAPLRTSLRGEDLLDGWALARQYPRQGLSPKVGHATLVR